MRCVVANDVNFKRAEVLVTQTQKLSELLSHLVIVNHEAARALGSSKYWVSFFYQREKFLYQETIIMIVWNAHFPNFRTMVIGFFLRTGTYFSASDEDL